MLPILPRPGSQEELQRTLAHRRLDAEGSREELEARLSAFLSAPAQHPHAHCSLAGDVWVMGGRLFGGMAPLRRHIQLLFELLQVRPGVARNAMLLLMSSRPWIRAGSSRV